MLRAQVLDELSSSTSAATFLDKTVSEPQDFTMAFARLSFDGILFSALAVVLPQLLAFPG